MIDDGMVIWINGVELDRLNMPDGQIEPGTDAIERISGVYELLVSRSENLPPAALRPGANVVAVEVHQATKDSSDTRFDLRLSATER